MPGGFRQFSAIAKYGPSAASLKRHEGKNIAGKKMTAVFLARLGGCLPCPHEPSRFAPILTSDSRPLSPHIFAGNLFALSKNRTSKNKQEQARTSKTPTFSGPPRAYDELCEMLSDLQTMGVASLLTGWTEDGGFPFLFSTVAKDGPAADSAGKAKTWPAKKWPAGFLQDGDVARSRPL